MNQLTTLVSARSCSFPCWTAKQPTCQCTCQGINHGALRPLNPSPAPDPANNPDLPFQLIAFPFDMTLSRKARTTLPTTYRKPSEKQAAAALDLPERLTLPLLMEETPDMNRYLISLTPEIIAKGQKCHLRECAMALAIANYRDQGRPIFTNVFVALRKTRLNDMVFLDHSPGIQQWILDHDADQTGPPLPATIVVDLDASAITLREETPC